MEMVNAPLARAAARVLGAGLLALALAATPARAIAWRPAESDPTLAFSPAFAVALTLGSEVVLGIAVAPGIDPGAALTDKVAMASADTLRDRDENALFGTALRALSPDASAYDAGGGEHETGLPWFELVSTLSSSCAACVGTNQTTFKLDLLKSLGLLPTLTDEE